MSEKIKFAVLHVEESTFQSLFGDNAMHMAMLMRTAAQSLRVSINGEML